MVTEEGVCEKEGKRPAVSKGRADRQFFTYVGGWVGELCIHSLIGEKEEKEAVRMGCGVDGWVDGRRNLPSSEVGSSLRSLARPFPYIEPTTICRTAKMGRTRRERPYALGVARVVATFVKRRAGWKKAKINRERVEREEESSRPREAASRPRPQEAVGVGG